MISISSALFSFGSTLKDVFGDSYYQSRIEMKTIVKKIINRKVTYKG